ncbi:MMPL family transporter [Cellulosimicrobium protaetiae]|uniref:MMPL family transporter n=1 Tax=Cellulosimicrobium protaetiae TaxID=2587808 RepID=A0A6M5UBK6_9MICO|nr:MMPL family transporter [Cellulosimicrobium protaetiae]QJW34821.1 MMPL family transporter [Cellulosimicrobium protaetiae]
MSSALYSLGRWAVGARRLVLAAWIGILVLAGALAGLVGQGLDDQVSIPGTESQAALDRLATTFPQVSGASAQVVVVAPDGSTIEDDSVREPVEDAVAALGSIDHVAGVTSPYDDTMPASVSDDDVATLLTVQLDQGESEVSDATKDDLAAAVDDLAAALPDGAQAALGGQLFSTEFPTLTVTEALGLLVALVVLVLTFGSFVAAGLPLLNAIMGVGVTMGLLFAATAVAQINSTTPMLAVMLGLAVGIDYALFIVSRHRDELASGLTVEEAAARSVATAGSAVIFAGLTVMIALVGLGVAGIPFLTVMGVAAAVGVGLAVLVSVTLLPAMLGFAGERLRPKAPRRRRGRGRRRAGGTRGRGDQAIPAGRAGGPGSSRFQDGPEAPVRRGTDVAASDLDETTGRRDGRAVGADSDAKGRQAALVNLRPDDQGDGAAAPSTEAAPAADPTTDVSGPTTIEHRNRFFAGWVRTVTRVPLLTIGLVVAAIVLLTLPARDLQLALPDAGTLPEDNQARVTYDLVSEHFGPGFNGPLIVTGTIVTSTDPVGLMDDLGDEIAGLPGVADVPLATPNLTGDTGIVQVVPTGAPDSEETKDLVTEIRSQHDHFLDEYGVDLSVTGFTAVGIDVSAKLGAALLPFAFVVVGLSLVLLTMVFRSIAVPIKATLGYLFSVGAAFGVVTLVFEHGVLADALHVTRLGPVISFMPIVLMGVLFGLAMDYEVFLVARIREDYVHSGKARRSIFTGFQASAKVVTAAAVIMFAVFVAFVPEGDMSLKPIALGLAVGVLVDAFVVRMTLVPAVLAMLGDKAWWMPRWLDRVLPSFDVEGEGLSKELALADWPEPGSTDAVVAHDLVVAGAHGPLAEPVTVRVPDGGSLVVHGASPAAVSGVVLALAGRLRPASGALKVTGLVLPERALSVRRRVALVDLAADVAALPGDAPAPAAHRVPAASAVTALLREDPRLLAVVGTDAVTSPAERAALAEALAQATARGTAVVLGAVGPAPTDLAPPGTQVLDLHAPDPAHTVPAPTDPASVAGPRTEEVPA